tara:strand:+ start:1639 stop:2736 length:1098 start_codon:yes stop_codon:yes gene_type:complete
MNLITRYILKYLLLSTTLVTVVLTLAVWMTQSLRLVDALINHGVTLATFLKMMVFLIPDLVGIILPVALVIGTLFTFSRFYSDRELIVFRTLGLSRLRLARGPLIVALLVTLSLYAINFYFMPAAFKEFKETEYALRNKISAMVVTPGDFTTLKGLTIYVRDRRPSGALYGLLIHDQREKRSLTLVAEKGVLKEGSAGIDLTLFNGSRQEVDPKSGEPSILSFDRYALEISPSALSQIKRQRKPYEYFFPELWRVTNVNDNSTFGHKLRVELHQRLLMPLTGLSFVLIVLGFFMGGDYDRRGRSKRIIVSVLCCTSVELGTFGLLNMSNHSFIFIVSSYGLVIGSGLMGFLYLGGERLTFKGGKV